MKAHLDECISDFSSTTHAEELVKPRGVPQLSMSDWGTLYFATSKNTNGLIDGIFIRTTGLGHRAVCFH
jgi:hypothetical protein